MGSYFRQANQENTVGFTFLLLRIHFASRCFSILNLPFSQHSRSICKQYGVVNGFDVFDPITTTKLDCKWTTIAVNGAPFETFGFYYGFGSEVTETPSHSAVPLFSH